MSRLLFHLHRSSAPLGHVISWCLCSGTGDCFCSGQHRRCKFLEDSDHTLNWFPSHCHAFVRPSDSHAVEPYCDRA
jgi:hypothetical protein